jgi:steroid 5-alpha reductase family enzyme
MAIGRALAGASRPLGFAVVAVTYLAAGAAAWGAAAVLRDRHPLAVTFWADLVATAVVFTVSTAVGNASLYDPYWSVAPAVIVMAWTIWRSGAAIALETAADRQLHRFTRDPANRGRVADRGLWRYSRHPNYLGEIGFWWGLWLFAVAAAPAWWWTIAGPIAMVLLFTFVSVPLMDRRSLERRPAYADHMRRVPALLPSLSRGRGPGPRPSP